jgi:hypothetical protein
MAIIENGVGELRYQLTDFHQHSDELEDCSTRFVPIAKIGTAVRNISAPSCRKVLLANDRIATALEMDRDDMPGSRVETLKQMASGGTTDANRFYEPGSAWPHSEATASTGRRSAAYWAKTA